MQRMYVIKGRKMMLGLIKKEQKWEIALQTTLGFKLSWSCNRLFKTRTTNAQWSLFSSKSQTFGLGQTIWEDKYWGIWYIFSQLGKLISLKCFKKSIETIMINQKQIHNRFGILSLLFISGKNCFSVHLNIFLGWV